MRRRVIGAVLLCCVLAACNIRQQQPIPSPAPTETGRLAPTVRASAVPASATALPSPAPASATLEVQAVEPSILPTSNAKPAPASPTSLYVEYTIGEGETLFYILQLPQHGYGYEPNVAATVVALNENIPNADSVRGGITIRIPRPTARPTAPGAAATEELLATMGFDTSSGTTLAVGAGVGCHEVVAGDAIVGIAVQHGTTLEILHSLNQELNWFGCNFTLPSGGANCAPNLSIGQCVNVPLPTPLPTAFPTPSGAETATPTATAPAPQLLAPIEAAELRAESLVLQWLGISGLQKQDEYLVEIDIPSRGETLRQVTRANSFIVPAALEPEGDGAVELRWRVSVARKDAQGVYRYVGGIGNWRGLRWQGAAP